MRRANGTGSVVKLAGNRRRPYAVRVSYRNERGRVRQKYLSYHARAQEAQEALDEWNRTHTVDLAASDYTLQRVYDLWSTRAFAKLNRASVVSYRASWARLSKLADKKMRRITIDDLQQIMDEDERAGLSSSSIHNDKSLMKALFRFAMERDIIMKDYSQFVEVPQVAPKMKKGALTDVQLAKLAEMARDGIPWADTALILCYTGFRVSEFLELTPESYHPSGDYLQGGKKTAAGRDRIVPVHPGIKPYLTAWLARGGERIICNPDGAALSTQRYRQLFAAVMEALQADGATPHWCRHTFASLLHRAGADELAIKRMLGHSDKDVTEHYTHVDADYLRRELLKVEFPCR